MVSNEPKKIGKVQLMTFPKAAAATGFAVTQLKSAAKNGQIRTVLVGKRKLIPASQLERLMARVRSAEHTDETQA